MEDFIIEIFNNNNSSLYDKNNDNSLIIEKYFFDDVNDSKNRSMQVIKRFDLDKINNSINNFSNQSFKTKHFIKLTDYYALPFLIIQKLLDSIDGRGCIIGKIKINSISW